MSSESAMFTPPPPFKTLMGANLRLKAVDIGANPSDGDIPPYWRLLQSRDIDIVGFEPHAPSLEKLNAAKGPCETYLPYAVGDGKRHTLRQCRAAGMNSLLPPNPAVMQLFHLYPLWSKVDSTTEVDTVRLDDLAETAGTDLIKIDIQGAELLAFKGGLERLQEASAIHTEVCFAQLYKNQPLFSEVEQFLRTQGYMFHRFVPIVSKMISPFLLGNEFYAGLSQVVYADAVFIRDLTRLKAFSYRQLMATAILMHDCYHSFDVTLLVLLEYDQRHNSDWGQRYIAALQPYFPNNELWIWKGATKPHVAEA